MNELTWEEVQRLGAAEAVAVMPVGAIEAHGPHLPLDTDVIIAGEMARAAAAKLQARGVSVVLLPPLVYTSAGFAAAFPGTISIRPETVTALLCDIAGSLAAHGFAALALANAHLDPEHIGSIRQAVDRIARTGEIAVAFPDLTRKPWALRLSEEFKSGACHAGQYETSVIMAARPEAVRESRRVGLADNPASLSDAIRAGHTTFAEAGGPLAYFGYPARATAGEGNVTIETLGAILEEAVVATLDANGADPKAAEGR